MSTYTNVVRLILTNYLRNDDSEHRLRESNAEVTIQLPEQKQLETN